VSLDSYPSRCFRVASATDIHSSWGKEAGGLSSRCTKVKFSVWLSPRFIDGIFLVMESEVGLGDEEKLSCVCLFL
jgi:hypothetical protein